MLHHVLIISSADLVELNMLSFESLHAAYHVFYWHEGEAMPVDFADVLVCILPCAKSSIQQQLC